MEVLAIFHELTSDKSPKELVLDLGSQQTNSLANSDSVTAHDQESVVSDNESCSSSENHNRFPAFDNGLVPLFEADNVYDLIKRWFLMGLGSLGTKTTVVSIHRNSSSGIEGKVRMQSFKVFAKAMEIKRGGNANVKYAWYGSARGEISKIAKHGFGHEITHNNGLYGCGIYLSPDHAPLECVKNLPVDEDGLRHVLLCRAILGKAEVVHPGSDQTHQSSEEFDSGIDNLSSPNKYIVWSTHMNTHVFPEYVISFRGPSTLKGFYEVRQPSKMPTSPWMPFPTLISKLSKSLSPSALNLIVKCYKDHKDKRISRKELIQHIRRIAGDKLLIEVIKSFWPGQYRTRSSRLQQQEVQTRPKNTMNCT